MDDAGMSLAENVAKEAAKEIVGKNAEYFDKMVNGAEKLIKPWKLALILTNLFWAIVLALFICFAYLTPTEMEQQQDFPQQQQEQSIKGAN